MMKRRGIRGSDYRRSILTSSAANLSTAVNGVFSGTLSLRERE